VQSFRNPPRYVGLTSLRGSAKSGAEQLRHKCGEGTCSIEQGKKRFWRGTGTPWQRRHDRGSANPQEAKAHARRGLLGNHSLRTGFPYQIRQPQPFVGTISSYRHTTASVQWWHGLTHSSKVAQIRLITRESDRGRVCALDNRCPHGLGEIARNKAAQMAAF